MSIRRLSSGGPVNDSERSAFGLLEAKLGQRRESYGLCTNIMFAGHRDRMLEIDAIVVAPSMIFVIEVKGWRGRTTLRRDRWFLEDGSARPNPGELLSRKAKELKAALERHDRLRLAKRNLWVQELLFVNGPGARLDDIDYGTRTSYNIAPFAFTDAALLIEAIVQPERWAKVEPFDARELESIDEYLAGGRKRAERTRIAQYVIEQPLAPTSDRFERILARDSFAPDELVELHVYPLDGTKAHRERSIALIRRQLDTVKTLAASGVTPALRNAIETETDDHPAFVVAYESLAAAQPLSELLQPAQPLGIKDALRYGVGLAEALAKLHAQGIVHGALEPGAIVLRTRDDEGSFAIGRIELARPALEAGISLMPASTVGALTSLYASPAVVQGKRPSERDDVYSFGAIFAHLVYGEPLFKSAADALRGVRLPPLHSGDRAIAAALQHVLGELLAREEPQRIASMSTALGRLRDLQRQLGGAAGVPERIDDYEVVRELRAGATGRTVVARRRNQAGELVLKIAAPGSAAVDPLIAEIELLLDLRHPNIVNARTRVDLKEGGGGVAGEFDLVPGADLARRRGKIAPEHIRKLVEGLFAALHEVHRRGWVHRDVKPANVMLTPEGKPVLLDFGLAARKGDLRTEVGTAMYKSRALIDRGVWLPQDDVFAAAVTVWEAVGGKHPWHMAEPNGEPALDPADLGSVLEAATARRFATAIGALLRDPPPAKKARTSLLEALGVATPGAPKLPLGPRVTLRDDVSLSDELATVTLSQAARGALAERGVATLDDVRRLRTSDLLRIRTVSRAAVDEIEELAGLLLERFGDPPEPPAAQTTLPPPLLGFAPVLADETLAIDVLGLPTPMVAGLKELGRTTVGEVALLRPTTVQDYPPLGPAAEAAIRAALAGLLDDRHGVVVDAALPPHRLASRSDFEAALVALGAGAATAVDVLQTAGGDVLEPGTQAELARALVFAPPWTHDDAADFVRAVRAAVEYPPREVAAIAADAQAALSPAARERLEAMGESGFADAATVVLPLMAAVSRVSRDSGSALWFAPATVQPAAALVFAAERLVLPLAPAELIGKARAVLPGVVLPPPGSDEFAHALAEAGLAYTETARVDRADATTQPAEEVPSTIEAIERSPIHEAVATVLATRRVASFRLIVTEPARHAKLARALIAALVERHGAERVRAIDVDSELCAQLERDGLLAAALRRDARGFRRGDLEGLAGDAARAILDDAVAGDDPDRVTVLYNTGGLAHTDATGYLRSVYDRARGGGKAGLVLVCVPGDHPREHARLNREIPLVVTGTEAPLYLEATA